MAEYYAGKMMRRREKADHKWPVGSLVVCGGEAVTVTRHGWDVSGQYTEIRHDNGETERVHRSMLKRIEQCEVKR